MSELFVNLISKYRRKGLLVDTNILLLYFIGICDPNWIAGFKRTSQFVIEDFQLLVRILNCFERRVTTPNVLTEINNLAGQLSRDNLRAWRVQFRDSLSSDFLERFIPSKTAVKNGGFLRCGLTDAGVICASRGRFLVLTDDLDLYITLQSEGVDAINFNHLRSLTWKW